VVAATGPLVAVSGQFPVAINSPSGDPAVRRGPV